MGFEGRTAIVTGAARGIGKAIAARLIEEGVRVAIADIDEPAARAAASELGDRAKAVALDVTAAESWDGAVKQVLDGWDRLDIDSVGVGGTPACRILADRPCCCSYL